MDRQTWLTRNHAAITARLQRLHHEPEGILFAQESERNLVIVDKLETAIRLRLLNPTSSLIQSRLDLRDPLYLVSPYSQASLLGLAWTDQPARVYQIGFGGGRLPLVLHHYLPQVCVEAAEIDPVVIEASVQFFGIQPDDRLVVVNEDARRYLAARPAGVRYDLIYNDAFSSSAGPYHLATDSFYALCRDRLTDHGTVIVTLLRQDPLYLDKVKTLQSVFDHIYLWPMGWGNSLLFGSNGPALTPIDLVERARRLQAFHQFSFSVVDRAGEVVFGPEMLEQLPDLGQAAILADAPESQ